MVRIKKYPLYPSMVVLILVFTACIFPVVSSEPVQEETETKVTVASETPTLPIFNYDYFRQPIETKGTQPPFPVCDIRLPSVTNFEIYQPPSMLEPQRGIPFRDPVFGTCVVRVTDRSKDIGLDDQSQGLKNEYSRVQSFNADGGRFISRGIEGTWYLYDVSTLRPTQRLPIETEPRWDAKDPTLLYYINETRLMSYQILAGDQKLLHEFSSDFPGYELSAVWTRYEGSPSLDDRYWGMMAQNLDWETIAFLVYDLEANRIISRLDLPNIPAVDSVTISPSGNYFLAYFDYCEPGHIGNADEPCGLMVYDRYLKNPRGLLRIIGHSDTALDASGKEILVFQNIDKDTISILHLETGVVEDLVPINFNYTSLGLHFSGRGFQAPGWAVVSTYNGGNPDSLSWMDDSIFSLELKPNGRIIRLAHTHSIYNENIEKDYWAEPHASPNQDMTRILFTSNWGRSGTEEVETYMIQLLPQWTNLIP